jgi:4-amino-4-deoxy-L-arabinose transferase-like glycosyltransferase
VSSYERRLLIAAILLGLVVRVAYVLVTRHLHLAGDAYEYDHEGALIAQGHWWWTAAPFHHLHPSAWKAPLYPLWVGAWYSIVGHHVLAVRLVQALACGPLTIALTWLLARRLFGWRVAAAAALVVAVYPLAFQYEELLYSEALAVPLTLGFMLLALTGRPTARRAAAAGALLGVALLIRPTSFILLAAALIAWAAAAGIRRGLALTIVSVAVAIACVAPWTIRNAIVEHGFLPISLQDSAAYGTFNSDAAADPVSPYMWRPLPPSEAKTITKPTTDLAFAQRLKHLAITYVRAHPSSLAAAFFWNGLSRLWDVRRPARALFEVPFEGRSRTVAELGLYSYYLLFVLALVGLWHARRRRALVGAFLATALLASVVFTIDSGTRYRAPFEPLIAILACSAVPWGSASQRIASARARARDARAVAPAGRAG